MINPESKASINTLIVGKFYPSLNGIRGFAVLLVLWFHSTGFGYEVSQQIDYEIIRIYYFLSIAGSTGVDLFFVLSGFLITGILIDTARDKNVFKNFYIRRALRIFPLYYMVLVLVLVFSLVSGREQGLFFPMIMHLIYLQNWLPEFTTQGTLFLNHTWTLAIEEQFYILWPVIFLSVYTRSLKNSIFLCLGLILVCWISRYYMFFYSEKLATTSTVTRMDGLVFGALLAVLCVHFREYAIRIKGLFLYAVLCSFLYLSFTVFTSPSFDVVFQSVARWGCYFLTVTYTFLVAHVFLSGDKSPIKKFFKIGMLQEIGKISYGIYIVHAPVMLLCTKLLKGNDLPFLENHLIIFFVGFMASFIIANLSYRFFEKPFIDLKDKYAPVTEKLAK